MCTKFARIIPVLGTAEAGEPGRVVNFDVRNLFAECQHTVSPDMGATERIRTGS